MCRVFSGSCNAVVTGAACSNDLSMVDRIYWHPYVGVVAILADITRLNVGRILARRVRAIMAIDAIVRNVGVIEIGRQPADG